MRFIWSCQVLNYTFGQTCYIVQFEKVAIELPTLAVWTTLFCGIKLPTLPLQFLGHILKLPILAVLWPVFSTLGLLVLKLPAMAVSWPLFSHLPYQWDRSFWYTRALRKGKRLWEKAKHHFRDLCRVHAHSGSRRKVSNFNAKMRKVRNFNTNKCQ